MQIEEFPGKTPHQILNELEMVHVLTRDGTTEWQHVGNVRVRGCDHLCKLHFYPKKLYFFSFFLILPNLF